MLIEEARAIWADREKKHWEDGLWRETYHAWDVVTAAQTIIDDLERQRDEARTDAYELAEELYWLRPSEYLDTMKRVDAKYGATVKKYEVTNENNN